MYNQFNSIQLLSHVWLFATPWTATRQASVSITNSQSLLKLMSIESVMPSNHLILCHPLLLPPSIFPTIKVFSSERLFTWGGQSIGVSASASIFPMNIQDWFPLEWTGWISLQSRGLSRVFSKTTVQKHQFFVIKDRSKEPGECELRRRVTEVCRKKKDKATAQEGNKLFHVFSRGTPSACTGPPSQHPGHRLQCHSVLSRRAGPPFLCSPRVPNTHRELNKQ